MTENRRSSVIEKSRGDDLRLVLLSDTHGLHRSVRMPDGDLLIHAGDFTNFSKSEKEIVDFNTWLGELPHRHKIVVPGNHEFFLEAGPSKRSLFNNATVLINETAQIEDLRIWGSPVTALYGGAFGMSSAADRKRLYSEIPVHIDVLISHGPPFGILDVARNSTQHVGCRELFDAVMRVKPRLCVFGHIHSQGLVHTANSTFVNAAVLGPHGEVEKAPIVLWLSRRAIK